MADVTAATVRGRFITIEGIEGVGKSTNLAFLESLIRQQGIEPVLTREPGGTASGERIRELLLAHGDDRISPETELLLFFAARALNLDNVIRPALKAGQWVLCDRFTDASRAYQGAGRGVSGDRIEALATWVHAGTEPDLTLLFDAPVAVGLARAADRGETDRMESERAEFFERVRAAYLDLARSEPERIRVIDASRSLADVQQQVAAAVTPFFSDKQD